MLFCALLSLLLLSIKPSSLDTLRSYRFLREKLSLKSSIRRSIAIPVSALLLPHLSVCPFTLVTMQSLLAVIVHSSLYSSHHLHLPTYLPRYLPTCLATCNTPWKADGWCIIMMTPPLLTSSTSPFLYLTLVRNFMQDRWAMMHAIVGYDCTASWQIRG